MTANTDKTMNDMADTDLNGPKQFMSVYTQKINNTLPNQARQFNSRNCRDGFLLLWQIFGISDFFV